MPVLWEPPYINGIAAQVSDSIITYDDLRRELVPFAAQLQKEVSNKEEFTTAMEETTQRILEGMLERLLLIEEFKDKKFSIPPFRVEKEYRKILEGNFEGKLADFVAALQSQGMTIDQFREDLEENMMAQAMQIRFQNSLPEITPEQVSEYYEAHQAKFSTQATFQLKAITLEPMTDEPTEVLTQTAQQILERLENGEDFDSLVQEFNQAQSSDWGTLSLSDLTEDIRSAVELIGVGEVSQPIVSDGKVLLIKVAKRTNSEIAPLDEVRTTIENALRKENSVDAYNDWIEQLKQKYYIKVNI